MFDVKLCARLWVHPHVQCTLGLGSFLPATVANHSAALVQAEVKSQQGAMLHADSPQCTAIDLHVRGIKVKCEASVCDV